MKNIIFYFFIFLITACSNSNENNYCIVEPMYCYKSIADITCYTHPLPGKHNQIVSLQKNIIYNIPKYCENNAPNM